MIYKVKPTRKQKLAVENILSGKFRSTAEAMRAAGYSVKSSFNSKHILADRKGVQNYVRTLSIELQNRWNMSVQDKVLEVYLNGLDATRPTYKGNRYPDHLVRLRFADRLAEFFGWIESG